MQLAFLIINRITFQQFHCEPKVQSINHTGKKWEGFFEDLPLPFNLFLSAMFQECYYVFFLPSVTISCQQVINSCCLLTFIHPTTVGKHSWILGFLGHWPGGQACATQHSQPGLQNSFSNDASQEDTCRDRTCSATSLQMTLGTYFWVDYAVDNKSTHT